MCINKQTIFTYLMGKNNVLNCENTFNSTHILLFFFNKIKNNKKE